MTMTNKIFLLLILLVVLLLGKPAIEAVFNAMDAVRGLPAIAQVAP